jgi:hypothetical protein
MLTINLIRSVPDRQFEEYLREQNNVGDIEVFTLEVFNLPRIYSLLSGPPASRDIKLQIGLTEWGTVDSPYRAYYGQVKIADVAQWTRFGRAILDKNIRFHRGATDVNDAMERTLVRTPRHFWYFNNRITVLCESATKPS